MRRRRRCAREGASGHKVGPEAIAAIIAGISALTVMTPVMIVRMILNHREKLTAMKYRQDGAPGLVEEVAALRREVAALRETTTKFDMSFDAAVSRLEDRVQVLESGRRGSGTAPAEETPSVLRRS